MSKKLSPFNLEFDSRILRTSISTSEKGKVTKPKISRTGELEQIYCLHCGKPGGAFTAGVPAALRHDPGFIYICDDCHNKVGRLPLPAISFVHRKES